MANTLRNITFILPKAGIETIDGLTLNHTATSKWPSHGIKTSLKYLSRASESVSPEGLAGPRPQTFLGGSRVCVCGGRVVAPRWGQARVWTGSPSQGIRQP